MFAPPAAPVRSSSSTPKHRRAKKTRGSSMSTTDDEHLVSRAFGWDSFASHDREGPPDGSAGPVTTAVVPSADMVNSNAPHSDTLFRVLMTIGGTWCVLPAAVPLCRGQPVVSSPACRAVPACCGGLMAATTQAFNTISKDVMLDTGTSDVFVSLLTGFGLAGAVCAHTRLGSSALGV